MIRAIVIFLFCSIHYQALAKTPKCKISRVEIKKFSREIHYSASFSCEEYDKVFLSLKNIEEKTLDTTLYDQEILDQFKYLFGDLKQFGSMKCNGKPQIKITVYLSKSEKVSWYLEDYVYLLSKKGSFLMENSNLKEFLSKLGDFN